MSMQKGERWLCQNEACGSEILVVAASALQRDENPRCSCGSIMKKPYVRPEVNVLRFVAETLEGLPGRANVPLDPSKVS